MRLNGWVRIGIIASIAWVFAGGSLGNALVLGEAIDAITIRHQICTYRPAMTVHPLNASDKLVPTTMKRSNTIGTRLPSLRLCRFRWHGFWCGDWSRWCVGYGPGSRRTRVANRPRPVSQAGEMLVRNGGIPPEQARFAMPVTGLSDAPRCHYRTHPGVASPPGGFLPPRRRRTAPSALRPRRGTPGTRPMSRRRKSAPTGGRFSRRRALSAPPLRHFRICSVFGSKRTGNAAFHCAAQWGCSRLRSCFPSHSRASSQTECDVVLPTRGNPAPGASYHWGLFFGWSIRWCR